MNILTLTMNPVLDKNTSAKMISPGKKLRCNKPGFAPGGGGINVSRAIRKLGGKSTACYLGGGNTAKQFNKMLKEEDISYEQIDSGSEIRENLMVLDETSNELYRFGMPGPEIKKEYADKVLATIEKQKPKPDYLVASGSLPPGIPEDFYARLAKFAKENDIRMILDTSGEPLNIALREGLYMIKPNLRELTRLIGEDAITGMQQEEAVKQIVREKSCEVVVLSLGAKGAMLAAGSDTLQYIVPPIMPVISRVGAGDSMVGGMVLGLTSGLWPHQAVNMGVAAGTAAAMTPGSQLCKKEDTDKIYDWINSKN